MTSSESLDVPTWLVVVAIVAGVGLFVTLALATVLFLGFGLF